MPRYLADSVLEGQPEGSWLCVNCNNVNYANRMVCNTRKCGMSHPGLRQAAAFAQAQEFQQPHQFQARLPPRPPRPAAPPPPAAVVAQSPRGGPEGSWTCLQCGNVNYPTREVCNTRKCRAPRPDLASAVVPDEVDELQAALFEAPPPVEIEAPVEASPRKSWSGANRGADMSSGAPEGSWACAQCGNVNFAHREVCNTRKCRAPRPVFTPMATPVATEKKKWTCLGCGNENYEFRTECNTRKCRASRPW